MYIKKEMYDEDACVLNNFDGKVHEWRWFNMDFRAPLNKVIGLEDS